MSVTDDAPIEWPATPPQRTVDFDHGGVRHRAALFQQPGTDPMWVVTVAVDGGDEDPGEQVHVVTVWTDELDRARIDLDRAVVQHLGRARPHLDEAYKARRHGAVVTALSQQLGQDPTPTPP